MTASSVSRIHSQVSSLRRLLIHSSFHSRGSVTVCSRSGRRPRSRVRRPQVRPLTIYCAPVRNPPCSTPFATILFGTVCMYAQPMLGPPHAVSCVFPTNPYPLPQSTHPKRRSRNNLQRTNAQSIICPYFSAVFCFFCARASTEHLLAFLWWLTSLVRSAL